MAELGFKLGQIKSSPKFELFLGNWWQRQNQNPGLFVKLKSDSMLKKMCTGRKGWKKTLEEGCRKDRMTVCKETDSCQDIRTFQAKLGCPIDAN